MRGEFFTQISVDSDTRSQESPAGYVFAPRQGHFHTYSAEKPVAAG